ncbi:YncE family protein [Novipirellula sp. SH528]|uniref:YncE family protein n=1 Tax=Novipirellula sp. SH528 TaxID=3454466 RepID=UPI003FA0CC95
MWLFSVVYFVNSACSQIPNENPFVEISREEDGPVSIELQGVIHDVVIGGGGQYLIAYSKEMQNISVIDLRTRKLVKILPANSEHILIAAGAHHLYVLAKEQRILQEYSLPNLTKTLTITIPVPSAIHAIAIGANSDGPLAVVSAVNDHTYNGLVSVYLIDPATALIHDKTPPFSISQPEHAKCYAAGNGRLFSCNDYLLRWNGKKAIGKQRRNAPDLGLYPNADGSIAYASDGWFDTQLQRLQENELPVHYIPAVNPGFLIALPASDSVRSISLHAEGQVRPLLVMDKIRMQAPIRRRSAHVLPVRKRLWLVPSENKLVHILGSLNQILIHDFDIEKQLEDAELDYLYVGAFSEQPAIAGTLFETQLQVRSKRGGVRYQIEAGPSDMEIDQSGRIRWQTPKQITSDLEYVKLWITDNSQQIVRHTIAIQLREPPKPSIALAAKATQYEGLLYRDWTDSEGAQVRAKFLRVFAKIVYLQSPDGQQMLAPLSLLSLEDREYIKKVTQTTKVNDEKGTPTDSKDNEEKSTDDADTRTD